MSPEIRRRLRPWKHVANAAKVLAALNIPVGFWVGVYTGHPVEPWALAQVSLWFYAFFSPLDVALIAGSIVDAVKAMKGQV